MRLVCFVAILLWAAPALAQHPVYFATSPSLTPDARAIVFAYEGDLWRVSAEGGQAERLTGMEGEEGDPRVSPDGQWIAFTARQDGNANVYVVPAAGGAVRQLTYHDADDQVDSWAWDSQSIYFTSGRYNRYAAYRVAVDGGTPERLFGDHYFNTAHHVAEHPETGALFFTESWESNTFAHRKGYKGPFNPDLKSYQPTTGAYVEHTAYEGKDFWPTIDRAGHVYFVSDEANGEYNVYQLTDAGKRRLTRFDTSVKRPHVSADGRKIVFERAYQLHLYDTATGRTTTPSITLVQNNTLGLAQNFSTKGNVQAFDAAPDGKKLAFVSRGELFVSDPKGTFVRQMPTHAKGRVAEVKWLGDSRRLLYTQVVDGWANVFTLAADGSEPERQLTHDTARTRSLVLNQARTQAALLVGRTDLRLMDMDTFGQRTVVQDEFWAYADLPLSFSPDDRFLAFTAYRDFETDVFVHELATGQTTNLTRTAVSESTPTWSPDGKVMYFEANRVQPRYPRGAGAPSIYQVPLQKYSRPFRTQGYDALWQPDSLKQTDSVAVVIDVQNMAERWTQVTNLGGAQYGPTVLGRGETQTLLFVSNHDGSNGLWKQTMKPFEAPETEKIQARIGGYDLVSAQGTHYVLTGGTLYTLNLDAGKLTPIEIANDFRRTLADEFEQMFYETWANLDENFYDGTFHGRDWNALRDRYAAYLPHLRSRSDLRTLLNDLLGELNTSHFGFNSAGPEEDTFYRMRTHTAGLRFAEADPFRVEAVVEGGALDRFDRPVRPGDRLVAVDGQEVAPGANRERYFLRPASAEEMVLSFERGGSRFDVTVEAESSGALRTHLYDAWIRDNQARVDRLGGERIAYIHMKNMGAGSLDAFLTEMASETHQRDALILDLRYNTGGNVHDDVLQVLSRRRYVNWKYRDGALTSQPNVVVGDKPIVLLINEQSLSDAEVTAEGFKQLGLGTVLGMPTYRWIIFTSGRGLVDGSFYRLPMWGVYTLDGADLELTGVEPDVRVPMTFEDRVNGHDPQLESAVAEILRQWR